MCPRHRTLPISPSLPISGRNAMPFGSCSVLSGANCLKVPSGAIMSIMFASVETKIVCSRVPLGRRGGRSDDFEGNIVGSSSACYECRLRSSPRDLRNRASRRIGYIKKAHPIGVTTKLRRSEVHPGRQGETRSERGFRPAAGQDLRNVACVGSDKDVTRVGHRCTSAPVIRIDIRGCAVRGHLKDRRAISYIPEKTRLVQCVGSQTQRAGYDFEKCSANEFRPEARGAHDQRHSPKPEDQIRRASDRADYSNWQGKWSGFPESVSFIKIVPLPAPPSPASTT